MKVESFVNLPGFCTTEVLAHSLPWEMEPWATSVVVVAEKQ